MAEKYKLHSTDNDKDYQTLNRDPESVAPTKKKKEPRRVIHCSDGVYEEYSTDEEEIEAQRQAEEEKKKRAMIDPKSLPWSSRVLHYLWMAGSGSMYYFDSWGERLAWFFGITSPKYYWEMQEFKRVKDRRAHV